MHHPRCAPNFRDLGGIRASQDGQIRPGLVFRSGAVLNPCEGDAEALSAYRIGLVFDLRSANECADRPNRYWQEEKAEIVCLDVGTDLRALGEHWQALRADASPTAVNALIFRIYRSLPSIAAASLRLIFDRLSAGAPPMLIHCAAGKDRTGFVVAMLLHALGVSRAAILEDYLKSNGAYLDDIERTRTTLSRLIGSDPCDETIRLFAGVRAEFLLAAFEQVERKFEGLDAYLEKFAGLDADKRGLLVRQLVSPA